MHFLELTYKRDATVPVPCFLLFLCFRKATQKIFSELDKIKAEPPIFPEASQSLKMRWRGAKGQPHPRVVRPRPWPRHQAVRPPGPPPDVALLPIYSSRWEKPKTRSIFLKTYCKLPPLSTCDREDPGALPDTLPGRGIPAEGLLHHHGHLQSDV
jgi:hypothetical protein